MSEKQSMHIAILGATSQIARDLIVSLSVTGERNLVPFARRSDDVMNWLDVVGHSGRYQVNDYSGFGKRKFDAIINFVRASNPAQIFEMGIQSLT
jgi:dTDP-4-dehydrorhamnose reductase